MKKILQIFLTFLKIGAFTFGGGYAMISVIRTEVVENHKWITDEEMLDMIAIAESTPGAIAINLATFIGYKVAGIVGSIAGTIAVALPALVIIILISLFFIPYMNNPIIQNAFAGIRAGVVVLIINAALKLGKVLKANFFNIALMVMGFCFAIFTKISVIWIILVGMLIGIFTKVFILKEDKTK
ncbi:MAG: chromate transporter [Oscillospiraceae bacterium]